MMETTAYKVLTSAQFAELQAGIFGGAPVDVADGYIHLSSATQLTETVRKHFAGQDGLFVLAVDLAALGGALRWEVSRGGALFPHFYGTLRMDHVRAHAPLLWQGEAVALPGCEET